MSAAASLTGTSIAPAARPRAKETLWRLLALALAHPTQEFRDVLADGSFHDAFAAAWWEITGRRWSRPAAPGTLSALEAGYITAFLHGRNGKPVASLLAGDHEELLRGLSRPAFMLNVGAFYSHFGLKAAVEDEGQLDEPDHAAAMAEFMAVLCHLEAHACARGADAGGPQRAQRDFLARFLAPLLDTLARKLRRKPVSGLDPTVAQLLEEMAPWARQQIAELEARVGPFRDLDGPRPAATDVTKDAVKDSGPQNLWG